MIWYDLCSSSQDVCAETALAIWFFQSIIPSALHLILHLLWAAYAVLKDKIIILLSPFLLFSCSQCEVSMRVRRAAAYQKYVMGCKWEAAVHALRCDMKAPSQLKSSAGPCKAQGNEPAAASSTVGPWFTGIFSFNYVLIYKFHAFFPGCLIVKE